MLIKVSIIIYSSSSRKSNSIEANLLKKLCQGFYILALVFVYVYY